MQDDLVPWCMQRWPRKERNSRPASRNERWKKGRFNLKSVVGCCHEEGGLVATSHVIQTIDNRKGSKKRNLISRSLIYFVPLSPAKVLDWPLDPLWQAFRGYGEEHIQETLQPGGRHYTLPEKLCLPNMVGSDSRGRNRVQGGKSMSFDRSRHPVTSDQVGRIEAENKHSSSNCDEGQVTQAGAVTLVQNSANTKHDKLTFFFQRKCIG